MSKTDIERMSHNNLLTKLKTLGKLVTYILLEGLTSFSLGGSSPEAWVEGRETDHIGGPSTQNSSFGGQ